METAKTVTWYDSSKAYQFLNKNGNWIITKGPETMAVKGYKIREVPKMFQVCPIEDCDKEPLLDVEVGNKKHNFCCQKGFEQSLRDFKNHLSDPSLAIDKTINN